MMDADVSYHIAENGDRLAYVRLPGKSPGIILLGGFRSDMSGEKAMFLEALCREQGRAFLRFDYFAHGRSAGDFAEGTIGRWAGNALSILDHLSEGPQLLIGSSMGGWLMLHAAMARPESVVGLIGIAAAPDFTEDLMWRRMTPEQRETLARDGIFHAPSGYGDPYPITRRLIEDGCTRCLLHAPLPITCPVRLLHGRNDPDVPWTRAFLLAEALAGTDVQVRLLKDGDHRLSSPMALGHLRRLVENMTFTRA